MLLPSPFFTVFLRFTYIILFDFTQQYMVTENFKVNLDIKDLESWYREGNIAVWWT